MPYSPSLEKLIKLFSKFPTVGPRTAQRFVFYLINSPAKETEELTGAIKELKEKVKICPACFRSFENKQEKLCSICSDKNRDRAIVCLVEKEIDLETIEKIGQYKGLYFILGSLTSPLEKEEAKRKREKRVNQLLERIKKDGIKEIILALNPTADGQNTALWLKRQLAGSGIKKISQLARGLPFGGELEYADEETLSSAFQNRK